MWSHAPAHYTTDPGWYFLTGGTYLKKRYLTEPARKHAFVEMMKSLCSKFRFDLLAWVVMINHYHLIIRTEGADLGSFFRKLHSIGAHDVNKRDGVRGRRVWYQYWDETIRTEKAYLAHVNYIHQNPVHHGITPVAENYLWSSAHEFAEKDRTLANAVARMKIDDIRVYDDF